MFCFWMSTGRIYFDFQKVFDEVDYYNILLKIRSLYCCKAIYMSKGSVYKLNKEDFLGTGQYQVFFWVVG